MTFRITTLALGALITLGACADPALTDKVAKLEQKINDLEKKVDAAPAGRGAGAARAEMDPAKEQGAREKIGEIQSKVADLDFEAAKSLCNEAQAEFGATQTFRRGGRVCQEVQVVGTDAAELEVEKWFSGQASLGDSPATLLVFWEAWCPHCKREVPKIEATYNKYKGRMNVVGLTKVNRSATDEKVEAFIQEHNLSYPVAKEKAGNLSQSYNVSGVPAAAIVKDGKVVWRGHPARLDDATLEKLL